MKKPSLEDTKKCIEIRRQAKRGIRLHSDDQKFVEKMHKLYHEWYASTEKEIFESTKPFGSI